MRAWRLTAAIVLTIGISIIPGGAALAAGCHVDGTIGTDTFLWECTNGNDTLVSGPQKDVVPFQGGADTGTHGAGGDDVGGGSGNDLIRGQAGNDSLEGGSGSDRMVGGAGQDELIDNPTGDTDRVCDGEGVDTIDVQDGDGNDTIYLNADGVAEASVLRDSGDSMVVQTCPFST